jgi:predicted hydrocarbon binding protein
VSVSPARAARRHRTLVRVHGAVHAEFRRYAIDRIGLEGWRRVGESAGLKETPGAASAATYPDEELVALLLAFGRLTDQPVEGVLTDFGRAILPALLDTYNAFIDSRWDATDVLENLERVIHRTVRLQDPAATPPHLKVERPRHDLVVIHYTSARRMCAFGKGLIHGLASRYGQPVAIDEPLCMHRGDEACVLRVMLEPAA